jgi:hypothetical protein
LEIGSNMSVALHPAATNASPMRCVDERVLRIAIINTVRGRKLRAGKRAAIIRAMSRRRLLKSVVFAAVVLSSTRAHADGFENIPTGSRTAAMGGAGIASGSDSAMPTLNPAGLASIPGSVASVSASLYQVGSVSVPHFIADGDTIGSRWGALAVSQPGVGSTELSTFPSGVAYFLHLGDKESPTILAASLSVPRNLNRRFVQNVEYLGEGVAIKDSITTVFQEQSYIGAFSWAGRFGALRVGASVLGSYTELLATTDRSELVVLGTARFYRAQDKVARSGDSFDLGVIAGVQFDLSDELHLGASVRSPSLHLAGGFSGSEDFTLLESGGEPTVTAVQSEGKLHRGFPLKIGAGIAYTPREWGIALDVTAFLPRSSEYRVEGTVVHSDLGGNLADAPDVEHDFVDVVETKAVINFALGFEILLTGSNWLRAGLFTDFSALESIDLDDPQRRKVPLLTEFPVNRFGASVGWGTIVGPIDSTFGVRGSFGSGDTLRIDPRGRYQGITRVDETSARVVEVLAFLSAAIDLSKSADLVEMLEK